MNIERNVETLLARSVWSLALAVLWGKNPGALKFVSALLGNGASSL